MKKILLLASAFFMLLISAIGCGKPDNDDESALQINMDEELPGRWIATELSGDLEVEVWGTLKADVKISTKNLRGGILFEKDVYKAEFDIMSDMTIDIYLGQAKIHTLGEDDVLIDSRLSYEVVTENEFRFYVNDSIDDPIYLFQYAAFDDISFFPIEKSETDLYLRGDVDVFTNFGDDIPELPSGDLPTTGRLYMRLTKVTD
ncbi:MAG: hypothetical protein JJU02_13675 [Cryomorphaceae bacterium]|nr:hypothetical protein [Cryomorphaceae bacterium]